MFVVGKYHCLHFKDKTNRDQYQPPNSTPSILIHIRAGDQTQPSVLPDSS